MCCLFTILMLFGPRLGILVWWLFDQNRWNAAFGSFIWPLLGFLFLPWTTIMFVLVGVNGISWFDWIWLGLALLVDLSSYGGGAYSNRDRLRYAS